MPLSVAAAPHHNAAWPRCTFRLTHDQDIAIASLYMLAKLSADPQSPRNVLNVAAYLVTHPRAYLFPDSAPADDARFDQLTSDGAYHSRRTALVKHEALLLRALGFQTHVALPFTLSINYLQTLDAFQKPLGRAAARQTFAHLNSALLSPQLLYLTHQPAQLATAAIYLACKQVGLKLPEEDWWLIFDTDREELGFLIVAFTSMDSFAEAERRKWKGRDVPLTVASLSDELDVPGHLHPHTSQPVAPDAS